MKAIWRSPRVGRGVVAAAAVVVCLLLAATPVLAQRGMGRMQGTVTDPEGNPLEGVTVTAHNPEMTPSTLTATTDENGNWAVLGLSNDDWKFTFEKDGYVPYDVDTSVRGMGRNPDLDVTLEPAAPTSGSGAGVSGDVAKREVFEEGNALFEQGDYEAAIAKWEEFLEANPTLVQVYFNVGNAHRELGNVEEARDAYEKVLEQNPADTRANYALGEMLVNDGQTEEAMPYFEKALEGNPDDAAVYYNVAELYFAQAAVEQAVTYYEQAVEVDPQYLSAWKQLGFARVRTGNNEGAIEAFQKYVELAPEDDPDLAVVKDVLAALQGGD